jgi:hypothetical protein
LLSCANPASTPTRFLEILPARCSRRPFITPMAALSQTKVRTGRLQDVARAEHIRLALAAVDATTVPMPTASLVHDHFVPVSPGAKERSAGRGWRGFAREMHGFEFGRAKSVLDELTLIKAALGRNTQARKARTVSPLDGERTSAGVPRCLTNPFPRRRLGMISSSTLSV